MKFKTYCIFFLLFCTLACTKKLVQQKEGILFKNVTVLPMQNKEVSPPQSVYIKKGKIVSIGKESEIEPAIIIDGTGKFLLPGLTEMHAHIPVPDEDDALVKETLFLYLSQGVTTIRGMLGNPYHLTLKQLVEEGKILGPRIYTSSPSMNGNNLTSPSIAREKVIQYQKEGYDFLKIHPGIPLSLIHI